MKIQLRKRWNQLIGSALAFTPTTRAFHFVCLVSSLALAYNIPLNYAVGLPVVAIVSAITLLLFTCLYYLSRVKHKTPLSISVFCLLGNLLFVGNFFLNSGIDGPTSLFFVLAILVIVAIVPLDQYKYWVTGNILVVLSLHLFQYRYPDFIPITYNLKSDRYLDISSAYVSVVAVSIFVFYFIRRSYEIEKSSAEQKAGALRLLNEERNKLMSIIAHDLRSPLGNIQAYLELLVEVKIGEEEAKVITNKLLQATRGTLDMLNNVLNWTQSQMNGLNFKLGPVNVFKLLSSQLLMLMDIAANKGITLEVSIDPNIIVTGNGEMIDLVVRNLVGNATKFTSPGGSISVHTRTEGRNCLIVVKDSGTGKPVNLSSDIFHLNGSSKAGTMNEKGVGLGLVLCKEYTEIQNGALWFECDAISGTTFLLQLPLNAESIYINS